MRHGTGYVAHLCLAIFVGIRRVVAVGIKLVVANKPVKFGLRASINQAHLVEPVSQTAPHRLNACYIAMHH